MRGSWLQHCLLLVIIFAFFSCGSSINLHGPLEPSGAELPGTAPTTT